MNRAVFLLFLFFGCMALIYGEAPELRNVIPNSWQKITRIAPQEEETFLKTNEGLLRKIAGEAKEPFYPGGSLSQFKVYKEVVGSDVFYRLITDEEQNQNYDTFGKGFIQSLIYDRNGVFVLLAIGIYNYYAPYERSPLLLCNSIDIIRSGDMAKGFMISLAAVPVDHANTQYIKNMKNQIAGRVNAFYFLMQDTIAVSESSLFEKYDGGYYPKNIPRIWIQASACLVDPKTPLRYGLQSAFDGDPATSYVENTEDDLIRINFMYGLESGEFIRKICLINGYAQNMILYKNNNRIKKIGTEELQWNREKTFLIMTLNDEKTINDNKLSFQFIEINPSISLRVLDIYKGDKYNDTCIAELNISTDKRGWLFGDINE